MKKQIPLLNRLKTPPLLQRIQWVVNPVGYMESAVQQHPDIFTAEVVGFGDTLVFVNHPQAIQEILTNDRRKYTSPGEENKILLPLVGEHSVFILDGQQHRQQRQLMMPPFHGDRMRAYAQTIRNLAEKVYDRIPQNTPFSSRNAMQDISLQVMLQTVFGVSKGERYQQLKHLIGKLTDVFQSPLTSSLLFFPFLQKDFGSWSLWGKFLRWREQIDEILYTEIAECRAKADPNRVDSLSHISQKKTKTVRG